MRFFRRKAAAVVEAVMADQADRRAEQRASAMRDDARVAALGGDEDLEVVGEAFYQPNLWQLAGARPGKERIRKEIRGVLVPEDDNPHDPNAVAVWIDGLQAGHLSRENALRYRPGLLAQQQARGMPIALPGVIAGGGIRDDGPGRLGVFLRHDPQDFGLASQHRQATVVVVAFRDLPRDRCDPLANFSPDYGYAYLWPFAEPPRIGQWAVVQGIDGPATVVIGAIGLPSHARGLELKSIDRLIPHSEVEMARAAHDAAVDEWLNMARRAAGLATTAPVSAKAPSGFDPLPPVEGTADAVTADNYASIWWRARKLASELGRDPDEVAAFQRIAKGWYRVRDRAARSEQLAAVTDVAESIDLSTVLRNVENRSRAEVESKLFAGKSLWDWLEYVQELGRQGRDDEALGLVGALITAAEQEAQMSGWEPAPAFTQRAAIIYRKRRDYLAEIAVLERWEKACPPGKRDSGAMQQTFVKRLMRARELAAKQVGRDT